MFFSDITSIFIWWATIFLTGFICLPIINSLFNQFIDRGYVFAKILGILFVTYVVFLAGTLKIAPFGYPTIILTLFLVGFISIFLVKEKLTKKDLLEMPWRIFVLEEIIFLFCLLFWSFIRAHEPSIHGLEKYMDFGFVNSILRTEYFPAKDSWLAPFSLNYYYFGHVVTAVLTKLSGINTSISYNLTIATLFAFTFIGAFSIGVNLIAQFKSQNSKVKIIGGLLAGFLVTLAGNLHTIYAFFAPYIGESPVPFWTLLLDFNLANYWYPNATRFIPLTIHEFPVYSFVVSDLHGHVLSIPIVLTIVAILLTILVSKSLNITKIVLLSFLLATAYMTNAWDGLIYFLLVFAVVFFFMFKNRRPNYILHTTYYILLLLAGFLLFALPFSLFFKPFVSGIGINCAPEFLTKIEKLGPFLFEPDHCQRSALYQLITLHGFWYFWAISFIVLLWKKLKAKSAALYISDIFVLMLIGLSTILILTPEFIYAKDIYPGHYRANTMFKLGYEAFMMLGISTAYIITRIVSSIKYQVLSINLTKKILYTLYCILASSLLLLVAIYPYFAVSSYYGELKTYKGLNGISYLQSLYPTDYEAILWIQKNIKGQPVILEAVGESYTDYARVSANTGLPTILGWPVHEWLWRGSYDEAGKRVSEVERIYTTTNINEARELLKTYNVEYIFIGTLERQKYPTLQEEIFKTLGVLIYENGETIIYQLRNLPR